MMQAIRRSPLHDVLAPLNPEWSAIHGMAAPLRFPGDGGADPIQLSDASCLPRMGVKGPQAEAWLGSQGVDTPAGVNSWTRTPEGLLVARLARSEFFVEDRFGGTGVARLRQALQPAPGVYPVTRQDAALVLAGERVNDLLVQTCNVNFKTWGLDERVVVMTSMVGVSVLVIWHRQNGIPCYRVWCDGTFGPYLWETLLEIAGELKGAAVGLQRLFPEISGA